MSFIRTVLGFLITIVVTAIAVMNREDVTVTFSPLHDTISLPLYIPIIAALALGFFIGSIMVTLNSSKLKKEKRLAKREIRTLEKKLNQKSQTPPNPANELFPALPKALK